MALGHCAVAVLAGSASLRWCARSLPHLRGGWIICPVGHQRLFSPFSPFSFFNASIFDKRVGWPSVATRAARPCRRPTLLAATTGLAPGAASRPGWSRTPPAFHGRRGLYGLGPRPFAPSPCRALLFPASPPQVWGVTPVRAMRRRCPAGLRMGPLDRPPLPYL